MAQSFSTEQIVSKLRKGEDVEVVTRYLYRSYAQLIRRFIRKQGGSAEDAEDFIQEVMVAFLQQVLNEKFEYRETADLKSYLIGIARRKWLKKLESDTRRQERQFWFSDAATAPEMPDQITIDAEYQSRAWESFQKLGETCRDILTAFYQEELSFEKIAVRFGFDTVGAAKMRKFRCLQKLLKLAEYDTR